MKRIRLLALIAILSLVIVACGGDSSEDSVVSTTHQPLDERDKVYEVVLEAERVETSLQGRPIIVFKVIESNEKISSSTLSYFGGRSIVIFFRDASYSFYDSTKGQTPNDASGRIGLGTKFDLTNEQVQNIEELEVGERVILQYRKAETPKDAPQAPMEPMRDMADVEPGQPLANPKWSGVIDWRATWSRIDKKVIFP